MTDEGRTIQVAVTGEEQVGPDRPEPASDSLIGNRYRVQRRIGKGGMGEVMLARDEQVGREVAIKRMRAANPSQRAIARFLREASVQGRLEHPAIVPVHEIGRDSDGLPFFVMKRAAGTAIGTPGYMAPEQVRGSADIDARADVYTLGCLLFELLAGEPLHPRGFQGMESALAQHETRPSLR